MNEECSKPLKNEQFLGSPPSLDIHFNGASLTNETLSVLLAKGDKRCFSWSSSIPDVA